MKLFAFSIALMLMLYSCNHLDTFEKNIRLSDNKWSYNESQVFEVNIPDTNAVYHPYINVKYTIDFPFRNIWLKASIKAPSGKITVRKINVRLSRKTGQNFGYRQGDIIHIQEYLEKEQDWFKEPGLYQVSLEQEMRQPTIDNLVSIGLKITREEVRKK